MAGCKTDFLCTLGLSSQGASFAKKKNGDNSDLLCKTHVMFQTGQEQEKNLFFFNSFVQTFGQIWMVVDRGYFSHASSHSENVASACRVPYLYQKPIKQNYQ